MTQRERERIEARIARDVEAGAAYARGESASKIAERIGLSKSAALRAIRRGLGPDARAEALRRRQPKPLKVHAPAPETPEPMRLTILVRDVIRHVSRVFEVPEDVLTGPLRRAPIVEARHAAMYLARDLTGRSYPQIGRALGKRDHSTVIHGCQKCALTIERDPLFRARVRWARRLCVTGKAFEAKSYVPPEPEAPAPIPTPWRVPAELLPKQEPEAPWWEKTDDELIEEAVRAHVANGGSFVEARA
jgi:hypothetical protein